jgi:LysR family transcriptional regulator, nod-box dependent transcriptional activator
MLPISMVNLRNIDLNLLVTLDALLRERNVTRAGHRLALSQPAMSDRLGRLRELFKDELLVRVGHRLEPTPLALELEGPLRDCIQGIQSIVDRQRDFDPATEQRTFTIAATDSNSFMLMPRLLRRLAAEAPGVTVRFTSAMAETLEQLGSDAIDFAVMAAQFHSSLPRKALFSDRWICATWAGNPRVDDSLTLEQYQALPHMVTFIRPQPDVHSFADEAVYRMGIERRIIGATANFLLAPFMLRGTEALMFLHERFAREVQRMADIRLLEPPFALDPVEFDLLWNPRHENDPPQVWMRSLLNEVASTV